MFGQFPDPTLASRPTGLARRAVHGRLRGAWAQRPRKPCHPARLSLREARHPYVHAAGTEVLGRRENPRRLVPRVPGTEEDADPGGFACQGALVGWVDGRTLSRARRSSERRASASRAGRRRLCRWACLRRRDAREHPVPWRRTRRSTPRRVMFMSHIRSSERARPISCSCRRGSATSRRAGTFPASRTTSARLASFSRLISFDKRGIGLSDRSCSTGFRSSRSGWTTCGR